VLDEHLVFTEQNGTGASAGFAHARAKLREVLVGIHHVAFDRLESGWLESAVIERDPKALELTGATELGPGHSGLHRDSLGYRLDPNWRTIRGARWSPEAG
jgi:hypothetical protein